jgi:hypothetical protein
MSEDATLGMSTQFEDHMRHGAEKRGRGIAAKLQGVSVATRRENSRAPIPGMNAVRDRVDPRANDPTFISPEEIEEWSRIDGQSNIKNCKLVRSGTEEYWRILKSGDQTRQRLRTLPGSYLVRESDGEKAERGQCYILAIPLESCHGEEYREAMRQDSDGAAKGWDERDTSDQALRQLKEEHHERMIESGIAGPGTQFSGMDYEKCMKYMETPEDREAIAADLRSQGRPPSPAFSEDQRSVIENMVDERMERTRSASRGGKTFAMGAGLKDGRVVR